MTKTDQAKSAAKPPTPQLRLIVLGYDEHHKPRAARFPAADADLVAKAAQLMDLKVYEAATEDLAALAKKLPVGRLYSNGNGFVPNVRQNLYSEIIVDARGRAAGRRRQRQRRPAGRDRPAPDLGRDRAWPSRDRPGGPGIRLVGGHRHRPQRRHAHAAVSGLPEAAQVRSASQRHRADEPASRITAERPVGSGRIGSARASPTSIHISHPKSGDFSHGPPRQRGFARSTMNCATPQPRHAVMTPGIAALGPEAVARIVKTIEVYDDFCHANDPHEEHDFGSFEADGHTIFFKIDYFDKTLTVHSPDPSDPAVTKRVITIMLAEEY